MPLDGLTWNNGAYGLLSGHTPPPPDLPPPFRPEPDPEEPRRKRDEYIRLGNSHNGLHSLGWGAALIVVGYACSYIRDSQSAGYLCLAYSFAAGTGATAGSAFFFVETVRNSAIPASRALGKLSWRKQGQITTLRQLEKAAARATTKRSITFGGSVAITIGLAGYICSQPIRPSTIQAISSAATMAVPMVFEPARDPQPSQLHF